MVSSCIGLAQKFIWVLLYNIMENSERTFGPVQCKHHGIKLQTFFCQSQMLPLGPLQAICSFQPQPLGTTDLFSVLGVLSFLGGCITGSMPCVIFRPRLLSFIITHRGHLGH